MGSNDMVMIAADGSDEANNAFQWYKEKLHKEGNQVIIVSALETSSVPTRESWDQVMESSKKKRKDMEDHYLKKLDEAGIKGTFVCDFEKPGQFLCSQAKEHSVDYIVMGTRGLGSVRRTIMGSVSDYVVHHAHCPVLIYKKVK